VAIPKISFEESLEKRVVSADKCMGCAACIVSCPLKILEYAKGTPKVTGKCTSCGICSQICPRYELSLPSLENFVFGRERRPDEEFGVYRRILVARAEDKAFREVCQDGGLVSALLASALEERIIDGAALSGVSEDKPFYPVPKLALSRKEVLDCAGARYSYSPNLLAFQKGVELKRESLAFVGTPCQIQAIRKMQMLPLRRYVKALNFTIGLMCTEAFTYEGLMEKKIRGELGIDLHNVKKINIKGKVIITLKSGEVKEIPLKETKEYAQKSCAPCRDFSAELADISAGGLGLTDWTFTIIRTEKGEEIFESAEKKGLLETKPIEQEEKNALDLLIKLSRRKRGRLNLKILNNQL
jgi:coenzyme F420 hydrogenase subunit beta